MLFSSCAAGILFDVENQLIGLAIVCVSVGHVCIKLWCSDGGEKGPTFCVL